MKNASIGIIGGAEGPTAVLVSGELLPVIAVIGAVILVAALIITAVIVTRRKK